MAARARAALAALRDLLRGFVGATRLAHDPRAVREALALRAEKRRSCC
jgi:hypothetical protein